MKKSKTTYANFPIIANRPFNCLRAPSIRLILLGTYIVKAARATEK